MCLAVPMKITSIDGFQCTCEAKGIEREVSLFMLQHETLTTSWFMSATPFKKFPSRMQPIPGPCLTKCWPLTSEATID